MDCFGMWSCVVYVQQLIFTNLCYAYSQTSSFHRFEAWLKYLINHIRYLQIISRKVDKCGVYKLRSGNMPSEWERQRQTTNILLALYFFMISANIHAQTARTKTFYHEMH